MKTKLFLILGLLSGLAFGQSQFSGGGNGSSNLSFGSQTINGTVYPSFGLGANNCSATGNINGITNLGNYPPGSCYGYAQIDFAPALFTNASSFGSGSIVVVNAAMATQISTHNNQFLYNGQIATPSGYSGNLAGSLYGFYHETDHNGTGTLTQSFGAFLASYDSGNGTISDNRALYAEAVNDFYNRGTTGTISANYAGRFRSGANHGTNTNDITILIDTPYTGGTFSNSHEGLQINDQTAGGVISGASAIRVGTGNNVPSGSLDWGANTQFIESTTSGFISIAAPTAAIGNTSLKFPQTLSAFSGTFVASGAAVNLTTQTAAISATTLATPTANGLYRIVFYLKIQTAGTTSSTLGPVTLTYTDASDSTAQSAVMLLADQTGTPMSSSSGNLTTTILTGETTIWAKSGVAIQYATGYASNPANFMTYQLHARLEQLN